MKKVNFWVIAITLPVWALLILFPLFFKVIIVIDWDCSVPAEASLPYDCPKTVSYEIKRR